MAEYTVLPPPKNLRRAWIWLHVGDHGGMKLYECAVLAVRINPYQKDALPEYLLQFMCGGRETSWEAPDWRLYFDEQAALKAVPPEGREEE